MSVRTFVKWIFAWMASMQIDFRKEIDPWCKYNPKVLACDGTHIGVSVKHMRLHDPVTSSDPNLQSVTPKHNREPQYFLHTRFWHDLFHGITHKCGKCFKSSRVCGMVGINSEICEQFNSYLQCIKYTGSHLSQSHFMFFVQFFIYLWNQEKTAKFENIIGIALAGAQ